MVSRTRLKTLAQETIAANARFFDNDVSKVPTNVKHLIYAIKRNLSLILSIFKALTVGVGTVMDAREVMVIITVSKNSIK